ncbi:MAG: pyridoxal phosphate-dependent decarboxylase family protein [Steroidobacteraceae bacterium]
MTFQALATLADIAASFTTRKRHLPVASNASRAEVQRFLAEQFPLNRPNNLDTLVRSTATLFERWEEHSNSPRHFGLFRPGSSLSCVTADALVALYNPNLARASFSPPGIEIEHYVLRYLGQHIGFGEQGHDAHFTSCGAEANQTAVIAALYSKFPRAADEGLAAAAPRARFYASSQAHHSLDKAAVSSGLGRSSLVRIPGDDHNRMRTDLLAEQIASDIAAGYTPFMVVATAGTTGTGAIDPLHPIAQISSRHGLWLHVDAAWGGAAALSPRQRPWLDGIDRADSVTWDAHKWLSVATGAGMFFCKHAQALTNVFAVDPAYVVVNSAAGEADPLARSLQWSRRVIGLKVLLLLAEQGAQGIAARIDHQVEMGQRLRQGLQRAGWQTLSESPFPVVCFSHTCLKNDRELHDAVVDELRRRNIAWITRVVLANGQHALRACVTHVDTNADDIDALVAGLSVSSSKA